MEGNNLHWFAVYTKPRWEKKIAGVLDEKGKTVQRIEKFDDAVLGLATKEKSSSGLGGMTSKLTFADLATGMGIKVVIFKTKSVNSIQKAMDGKTGTLCVPKKAEKTARQKWLASGSLIIGGVQVDEGAKKALLKRKSLLAVGVKKVINDFKQNEAFEIVGEDGVAFAVAKAKTDSSLLKRKDLKNIMLANADDIVIL